MKIIYTEQAKNQLQNIKVYISKDNKKNAIKYLLAIKQKIEILGDFPYIGVINTTINTSNIRDLIVFGYKRPLHKYE
ncbi:hypothetical protein SPONN_2473 [uncultured Candidatus Thioglobus sp.]|nr:hypothetical protein SPONN_2473 [uncultured Candidatus Thioglobus sp.]